MNVSSYLEAFLTVYGWQMYYVLYLLFGVMGLFLYPIARIVNDVFIAYLSGSEYAGTNFLRKMLTMICLTVVVFFIAVVPVAKISLNQMVVKTVCSEKNDADKMVKVKDAKGDSYFSNIDVRVPIMPWLAMSVGQGISTVIYKQTPCVIDVTKAHNRMMSVNLESAKNPEALKTELGRFVEECHKPAINLAKSIIKQEDKYDKKVSEVVKLILAYHADKNKEYLLYNYDSPFLKKLFYSSSSPLMAINDNELNLPLKAKNAVADIKGYDQEGSKKSASSPPSCGDWWESGGKNSLRVRVLESLTADAVTKVAATTDVDECEKSWFKTITHSVIDPEACKKRIVKELYQGDEDKLADELFVNLQGGTSDKIVSSAESLMVGAVSAVVAGAGAVASLVGIDLGIEGITGSIGSFYASLFILKILLYYLLPMVLMAIYMFWGAYMVIGEFRGMVMIKGMIIIIALNMMPGLWAVMEHIDDGLYEAMYGSYDMSSPLDRILLDVASSIFQLGIVFVLFYLIGEAGGANVGGALASNYDAAKGASGGVGKSIGGSSQRVSRWGIYGHRDTKTNKLKTGGYGVRTGSAVKSGIKNGANRMKKK